MTANAQIEAAWNELAAFASSADALGLSETRAIFSIGSLPGGYFRPGQSDLDVLVLFQGAPDAETNFTPAQQAEKVRLEALTAQAEPYEMELIFLHESRLQRDPLTGRFPYADFAQRLLSQSRLLWGAFDLDSLVLPGKEDFACAFRRYLDYFLKNQGGELERFWREGQIEELLKHALVLMRTYLQVQRSLTEYDKTRLAQRYRASQAPVPLPPGLASALEAQVAGEPLSSEIAAAARAELPAFHAALVGQILNFNPE
ncbi:MAG: hypothetical protein AAGU04_08920 [Anaerolineaceae bacterium]